MTPDELRAAVDDPALRRQVPAVELAGAFLERIDAEGPRLNAFVTVCHDLALADARRADDARAAGSPLPLDGLPVAVKDNVDVGGVRATVGSRLFAGRVAAKDAEAVRRLRAAGGVVLGKTGLHELAFGGTSRNEAFGSVVNPWDPARIPGGSSGGSGVAVAADLCAAALGTDTGGSVRLPAAFAGVTGLRPTLGLVPTRGVFPVSWTLDTVGPLARSALDVAALLRALAGFDPLDPSSDGRPLADDDVEAGAAGLRVGLVETFLEDADPAVERAVRGVAETLADLGAAVRPVTLPGALAAGEACGTVIRAEANAVHRRDLALRPELFEEGTRRRLALDEGLGAPELARALRRMREWQVEVRAAFETVDLLLAPTTPGPAPPAADADTVATTAAIVPFTFAVSLAGAPAVSVPCGEAAGVPVGAQLVAPWRRDLLALRAAAAHERATDWHRRRPPEPAPAGQPAGSTRTTS